MLKKMHAVLKMHAEKVLQIYGQKGWRQPSQSNNVEKCYSILFTHSQLNNNTYCHFNTFALCVILLYLCRFLLCIKHYINSWQTNKAENIQGHFTNLYYLEIRSMKSLKICFLKVTKCAKCDYFYSDQTNEILRSKAPTFK